MKAPIAVPALEATIIPAWPTPRSASMERPLLRSACSSVAVAWFAEHGVTVERVLSDNGSAYRSLAWRDALYRIPDHAETNPPLPASDQRQASNDSTAPLPTPGSTRGATSQPNNAIPHCPAGCTLTNFTEPTPPSEAAHRSHD